MSERGAARALPPPPDVADGPRRRRADIEHDFFATVVEDAFSEILAFDAETFAIFLANKSLRQNLGYAATEIIGFDVSAIKAEFSTARLKEIYRPLLEGETTRIVVHTLHRRKDGSTYPVEVHSRKSRLDGRVVIFQIAIDQTEIKRKQVAAELASQIERDAAESRDRGGFLTGVRLAILCGVRESSAAIRQVIAVYDEAYASLIERRDPLSFRRFLLRAPSLFVALGEKMGAMSHLTSFWNYRFPKGMPVTADAEELSAILHDFVCALGHDAQAGKPAANLSLSP